MSLRKRLLGTAAAGLMGLSFFGGAASSAQACESDPCYRQVWVTDYETREVPYTACFTAYDSCNHPYHVYRTVYRSVSVPVRKLVTVSYRVY